MIECFECNKQSEISEWNKNTIQYCGADITPIENVVGDDVEVFFYCPKCNIENYASDLI